MANLVSIEKVSLKKSSVVKEDAIQNIYLKIL